MNAHQRRIKLRKLLVLAEAEVLSHRLTGAGGIIANWANSLLRNHKSRIHDRKSVFSAVHKKMLQQSISTFNWWLVGGSTKRPDGLREVGPNAFDAKCCKCGGWYEWEGKPHQFDYWKSYCNNGAPTFCQP